mmetsp:Transcript_34145/g.57343  ORF Transcript_34145/g.57343 Transcript_34145/m.57343 type:complete len:94 (+) Transcript_34145:111-392(+)
MVPLSIVFSLPPDVSACVPLGWEIPLQIVLMVSYGNFYYIFIAIIQLWITKIVYSFCTALNRIDVDRLTVLRRPGFLGAALHQSNVVIATRYY